MYIGVPYACLVTTEARRRNQMPRNWSLQLVMSYHVAVGIHLWGTGPGIQGFVHTRQTHSHKETFLIWRWLLGRIVRGMEGLWTELSICAGPGQLSIVPEADSHLESRGLGLTFRFFFSLSLVEK